MSLCKNVYINNQSQRVIIQRQFRALNVLRQLIIPATRVREREKLVLVVNSVGLQSSWNWRLRIHEN